MTSQSIKQYYGSFFKESHDRALQATASAELRNPEMPFANFEDALRHAGTFGRIQLYFAVVLQLSIVAQCGNYLFMSFAILEPKITCNQTMHSNNMSHHHLQAMRNGYEEELCTNIENCDASNQIVETEFFSVVQEYELYCDRSYIANLFVSLQMLGAVIGGQLGGYLADHYGRKPVAVGGLVSALATSLLSVASTNWIVFAVFRVLIGFELNIVAVSLFVWAMEFTCSKNNMILNLAGFWQFWYMICAGIGYVTRDWRIYLIVVNFIASIPMVLLVWFPESPRWLLQKQRTNKAARVLARIQKVNRSVGHQIKPHHINTITVDTGHHYTVLHLFSTRRLACFTVVLSLSTFSAGLVTNSFLLNLKHLAGDPFFDIFIYGLSRSWIPFTLYVLDSRYKWFGRRLLFLVTVAAIAACLVLVCVLFFTQSRPHQHAVSITTFAMLSAIFTAPLWVVTGQFSIELYPTLLRNIAVGFGALGAELGGVVAPQLLYLDRYYPALPYIFLSVFLIATWTGGFWMLPETKGRPLPDTLSGVPHQKPVILGRESNGIGLRDTDLLVDDDSDPEDPSQEDIRLEDPKPEDAELPDPMLVEEDPKVEDPKSET